MMINHPLAPSQTKPTTWKLSYGCWNGNLTSRDSAVEEYESLAACRRALAQYEIGWARIGYRRWGTQKAIGPNGEVVEL